MDKNNNDILKFVGKKIRDLRNRYGFSQEELGFRCNLDRTYISDIELGKRNVSLLNIQVIADALEIHISRLFPGFRRSSSPISITGQSPYKTNKHSVIRCGFEVKGWILLLNQENYISRYQKVLSFKAK